MAPAGNSAMMVTTSLPGRSLPAAAPPSLRKSLALRSDALPVPTTISRLALTPSGARKSSVEALLPLNWLAAAARLIIAAAGPNALLVAGPNFSVSSQNTTRIPRGALENGTKPTLTASGIGKSSKIRAVAADWEQVHGCGVLSVLLVPAPARSERWCQL